MRVGEEEEATEARAANPPFLPCDPLIWIHLLV